MARKRNTDGFSLVEVIVALGILSTAALSLSTIARDSLAGVKQVEARYLARAVADTQLVETYTQAAPLEIGVTRGEALQMGQRFVWQRVVTQTDRPALFAIEVTVSERESGTVMAQLSTLRRGP